MGCGTGLSVRPFVDSSSYRVGVDVSLGMLEQAKKRGVFDEYIENDILSYVCKSEDKFDLIICTDTLDYLGDLSDFVKNISNVMKKDTPFIFFSTERSDSEENHFTIGNSELLLIQMSISNRFLVMVLSHIKDHAWFEKRKGSRLMEHFGLLFPSIPSSNSRIQEGLHRVLERES